MNRRVTIYVQLEDGRCTVHATNDGTERVDVTPYVAGDFAPERVVLEIEWKPKTRAAQGGGSDGH